MADVKKSKLVDDVIVFIDGRCVTSDHFPSSRPDVSKTYNNSDLLRSGYNLYIPKEKLSPNSNLRIIAISGDAASELKYNKSAIAVLKKRGGDE